MGAKVAKQAVVKSQKMPAKPTGPLTAEQKPMGLAAALKKRESLKKVLLDDVQSLRDLHKPTQEVVDFMAQLFNIINSNDNEVGQPWSQCQKEMKKSKECLARINDIADFKWLEPEQVLKIRVLAKSVDLTELKSEAAYAIAVFVQGVAELIEISKDNPEKRKKEWLEAEKKRKQELIAQKKQEKQAAKEVIKIDLKRTVVIEYSFSSGTHKYKQLNEEFAHELANAIREASPEKPIHVLLNQVPKEWAAHETYSELIKKTEGESSDLIPMQPRAGALELTCCAGETKVYSYIDSQTWPFITFVAHQVIDVLKEAEEEESKK